MNLPSGKEPVIAGFEIEDAESWRLHDSVVDQDLRYFEAQTGGARFPRRTDLNPVDIKSILPEVALLDPVYDANGFVVDVKISLLGSKLDNFYGSMTGKLLSQFPVQAICMRIMEACKHCIESKKPIVVSADTLSDRKNYLAVTVLYVPMSDDGVVIDRIFIHNQVKSRHLE